jgi:hypothetical protein
MILPTTFCVEIAIEIGSLESQRDGSVCLCDVETTTSRKIRSWEKNPGERRQLSIKKRFSGIQIQLKA